MYSGKDPLSHLRVGNGDIWFSTERLEPRVLPWQQLRRCHSLRFVMYISGAKFEEHCFNISRDIVNGVLYCFSGTIYEVIIQKCKYLHNKKKDIPKRKTPFFFALKSLSNKQQLLFTS